MDEIIFSKTKYKYKLPKTKYKVSNWALMSIVLILTLFLSLWIGLNVGYKMGIQEGNKFFNEVILQLIADGYLR